MLAAARSRLVRSLVVAVASPALGVPIASLGAFIAVAFIALALAACPARSPGPGPTTIAMDFTRAGGFFSAPFPSEDLRGADSRSSIDLSRFPSRGRADIVDAALRVAAAGDGFSRSAGVFFTSTAPLDPASLPASAAASLDAGASVYLVDVERGERAPVEVSFAADGGPFGAANMLAVLPFQGVPLRASTIYAAVITSRVRDAEGGPLGRAPSLDSVADGKAPPGLSGAAFADVRAAEAATRGDDVVALAAFRTGDPLLPFTAVRDAALAEPTPVPNAPFVAGEVFDDFCVFSSTIDMPVYQAGDPPYESASDGGAWAFDESALPELVPVLQRRETANIVVTLPRRAMPAGGFPVVVLSRTGAGGERPLVDRGPHAIDGTNLAPGTGLALDFARAGFAGVSVDGPLGGLRNTTGGDEQFLIFNIFNPDALRDNVRQSAIELVLVAHTLDEIVVDASACPGLVDAQARFSTDRVALFGHSMGATIAPLAIAFEPRYGALIMSGAGGSFIANVIYKQKPIQTLGVAELLLGYGDEGFALTAFDPALSFVQWAAEGADPPLYGARIREQGAHVLVFQGIVDHYILPPMANATSLSLDVDLVGEELDAVTDELAPFAPFSAVAPLANRRVLAYPASANDGARTAVVVQHAEDGIEDGHEVAFQRADARAQLVCFLSSWLGGGAPMVPSPSAAIAGECGR